MISRRIAALLLLMCIAVLGLAPAGCGSQRAAGTSSTLSLAAAGANPPGADPYAQQVAQYLRTGIPVALPRSGANWELPYAGPVLTRRGLLEPACGVPQLHLPLRQAAAPRWVSGARRASVPGIPWGHPQPSHTGTAKLLFLLSRYNGNSQRHNSAAVEEKMFGDNNGRTSPSLNALYNQMSYGALSIAGECFPKTGAYQAYTDATADLGAYMQDVLNAYLGDGGSFNNFDGNNDGFLDGLVFILPGEVRSFVTHFYWDELEQYFGKKIISVCFLGESDLDPETNTMHHEMGHIYYLPDYYDYGGDIKPPNPGPDGDEGQGDGYWELMCAGNCTNPPMPFSPFNKWILGWLQPVVLTQDTDRPHAAPGQRHRPAGPGIPAVARWRVHRRRQSRVFHVGEPLGRRHLQRRQQQRGPAMEAGPGAADLACRRKRLEPALRYELRHRRPEQLRGAQSAGR